MTSKKSRFAGAVHGVCLIIFLIVTWIIHEGWCEVTTKGRKESASQPATSPASQLPTTKEVNSDDGTLYSLLMCEVVYLSLFLCIMQMFVLIVHQPSCILNLYFFT